MHSSIKRYSSSKAAVRELSITFFLLEPESHLQQMILLFKLPKEGEKCSQTRTLNGLTNKE